MAHDGPRDGFGRWEKGVESYERDAEAFRLRARGWTYDMISDELGYGGHGNVKRAMDRVIKERTEQPVAEYREVMDLQLDDLWRRAEAVLEARHLTFYQGMAITHEGDVVLDDAPVLRAVDALLKIQERRAKLHGTDAPAKFEGSQVVRYTIDGIDPETLR